VREIAGRITVVLTLQIAEGVEVVAEIAGRRRHEGVGAIGIVSLTNSGAGRHARRVQEGEASIGAVGRTKAEIAVIGRVDRGGARLRSQTASGEVAGRLGDGLGVEVGRVDRDVALVVVEVRTKDQGGAGLTTVRTVARDGVVAFLEDLLSQGVLLAVLVEAVLERPCGRPGSS